MTDYFLTAGYHAIGKAGRPNEDRFRLLGCERILPDDRPGPYRDRHAGGLFGVFDGVGSCTRAGAAAQRGADALVSAYTNNQQPLTAASIAKALQTANDDIHGWGFIGDTDRPLGACTATVCWLDDDQAHLFHVGDSAAYHWNDQQRTLRLMTLDHTLNGGLTRYLGLGAGLTLDERAFAVNSGDLMLLCTDGLTKGVRKDEMSLLIEDYLGEPGQLAACLAQLAQRRKVQDDITVAYHLSLSL